MIAGSAIGDGDGEGEGVACGLDQPVAGTASSITVAAAKARNARHTRESVRNETHDFGIAEFLATLQIGKLDEKGKGLETRAKALE